MLVVVGVFHKYGIRMASTLSSLVGVMQGVAKEVTV